MATPSSPLREAFLNDHQKLTRGLSRTLEALREGDDDRASAEADALDRAVGPHMEFEERVFYPELAKVLGKDYVKELYGEHHTGQRAVQALMDQSSHTPLDAQQRENLINDLGAMLDHAVGCGTLLSHLDTLTQAQEERLFKKLVELRASGARWSDRAVGKGNSQSV